MQNNENNNNKTDNKFGMLCFLYANKDDAVYIEKIKTTAPCFAFFVTLTKTSSAIFIIKYSPISFLFQIKTITHKKIQQYIRNVTQEKNLCYKL